MAEIRQFVLDATVATKWHLRDETQIHHALAIRQDFLEDRIRLIAPSQLRSEVAAAILKATRNPQNPWVRAYFPHPRGDGFVPGLTDSGNPERRHKLSPTMAEEALGEFLEWPITYVPNDGLTVPAFRLARRLGSSYYDGLYLALAESARIPLVHADLKLRRTLTDRFNFALWIEDYHR